MGAPTPIGIVISEQDIATDYSYPHRRSSCSPAAERRHRTTLRLVAPERRPVVPVPQEVPQIAPVIRPAPAASATTKLWICGAAALVATVAVIASLPSMPNAVAGLSLRQVASIEAIVFLSGLMSGLSGFGFSAIGAASLLFLAPILQVPLFQTLSTGNQLLSAGQLRHDMPKSLKDLWSGPGPCMVGGAGGVPIGVWLLSHLPAARLMVVFGSLLAVYAIYSLFKPARLRLRGFDGPVSGAVVGFVGGVTGGFTAFPGAAVVVWTGLRGLTKERNRAIVQPYIIMSQLYSLGLVAWLHPDYLGSRFWLLVALTLPAVVPGTLSGLALYRRVSDSNFRRVTFLLLGIAGVALLAKICAPAISGVF